MKKIGFILSFFLILICAITNAQSKYQEKLIQTAQNEKKNSQKRVEAIKNINDQNVLIDLAKHDTKNVIRFAAFKKITDQSVLAEIANTDEDNYIRQMAVRSLSDQDILVEFATKEKSSYVRLAAVEKVSDQSILLEIIKTDQNEEICQKTLEKLVLDEEKRIDIAKNCKVAAIRGQLIDEINDEQTLMEIVKTDSDWVIRAGAFNKIKDRTLLLDIAKARLLTISDLNEGIIALKDGDVISETFRPGITIYGIVENTNNFSISPQKDESVIIEWNNSKYVYGEKLSNMSELAVLRLGDDQEYLIDISKNAFRGNCRYFALKLLTDVNIINNLDVQNDLADIAHNDDFEHVRIAAIENISNQKILNEMVNNDEYKGIHEAIKKRLNEISK